MRLIIAVDYLFIIIKIEKENHGIKQIYCKDRGEISTTTLDIDRNKTLHRIGMVLLSGRPLYPYLGQRRKSRL